MNKIARDRGGKECEYVCVREIDREGESGKELESESEREIERGRV